MLKKLFNLFFLFTWFLMYSCSSTNNVSRQKKLYSHVVSIGNKTKKSPKIEIDHNQKSLKIESNVVSKTFKDKITSQSNHFIGFSIYDLEEEKSVFAYNKDFLFTPASTVKLWTYYTAYPLLNDSIPLFKYLINGKNFHIRGTGNPTVFHPKYPYPNFIKLLKNLSKGRYVYYNPDKKKPGHYGPGWAWEDYTESYQPEVSAFPIHGNVVLFEKNTSTQAIDFFPKVKVSQNRLQLSAVYRDEKSNTFHINPNYFYFGSQYIVPYIWEENLVKGFLQLQLDKSVFMSKQSFSNSKFRLFKVPREVDFFRYMLHRSDNFTAEQLLHTAAQQKYNNFDTKRLRKSVIKKLFSNKMTNIRWVDGSGLSRYNLFSPNHFITLLGDMYSTMPWEDIKKHLPSVGKGTLIYSFWDIDKDAPPWLYAKTGSISNNYAISGYIVGKSGKKYAFSFMNNHFMESMSKVQMRTCLFLQAIHNLL